jgi:PAS domain S-box-containing protein
MSKLTYPYNKSLSETSDTILANILQAAFEAIFLLNEESNITFINHRAEQVLGYRSAELMGKSFSFLTLEIVELDASRELRTFLVKHKNGTSIPVEAGITGITLDGQSFSIISLREARLDKYLELRESKEQFQTAFDYSAIGMCVSDIEGKLLLVNQSLCDMSGLAEEDLIGKHFGEHIPAEDLPTLMDGLAQLISGKTRTYSSIVRYINKTHQSRWAKITSALLRDAGGHPHRIITQIEDINEQKEREEATNRQQNILQLFVDYAPAAIAMFDRDMKYLSVSRRFLSDYEVKDQDIIGKSHYEVFPEINEIIKDVHRRCLAGEVIKGEEDPFVRASGKLEWIDWAVYPWQLHSGEIGGIILFSEVVTKRKLAQERSKTQLARMNTLHAIDLAITTNFDLHAIMSALVKSVISSLGVDATDILMIDPAYNRLNLFEGQGFRAYGQGKTSIQLEKTLAGQAVLERKTILIPDLVKTGSKLVRHWLEPQENFSTYLGVPLFVKGEIKGVLEIFNRTQLNPDAEWLDFLEILAGQASIAIENFQVKDGLRRANLNLSMAYDATIEGWSRAMDLRDKETEDHTKRVTDVTLKLARILGVDEDRIIHIRRGCLLHDIGKLGVPDGILLKPAKLTSQEWEIMHKHPQLAFDMISPIEYLHLALDIPYCHHEKWDGTGYPRGLKGGQIPIAARIFAVVDVWDALRSERPYRPAWPEEKVLEYIKEQSGRHFDPEIVDIFLQMIKE